MIMLHTLGLSRESVNMIHACRNGHCEWLLG